MQLGVKLQVWNGCVLEQLRDYSQDLDALLVAKPARLTPEMTAMWQDHIGKALLKPSSGGCAEDANAAVDEAEDISLKLFCSF